LSRANARDATEIVFRTVYACDPRAFGGAKKRFRVILSDIARIIRAGWMFSAVGNAALFEAFVKSRETRNRCRVTAQERSASIFTS